MYINITHLYFVSYSFWNMIHQFWVSIHLNPSTPSPQSHRVEHLAVLLEGPQPVLQPRRCVVRRAGPGDGEDTLVCRPKGLILSTRKMVIFHGDLTIINGDLMVIFPWFSNGLTMVNNGMIWELPSGYLTVCELENEPFSSMMYQQQSDFHGYIK